MEENTNYFSLENLNAIADIEGHIVFAEELTNKYKWTKETEKHLRELLEKIKEKQSDEKLNLSVTGEFSVGKSSFINALLRRELLAVNILQGTTAVVTVIENSDDYRLSVIYKNGSGEELSFDGMQSLREKLSALNRDSSLAETIRRINVFLPSETLKKGFRIIDTPGANSTQSWHEETTVRAVRELSDMMVILTNATQPLPESLTEFINGELSDAVDRCVVIATKTDMIPQKERETVLKYIERKAEAEFGQKSIPVLPYAAFEVTKSSNEDDCDDELLSMSLKSEERLFEHMLKFRILSQFKKLTNLLDIIYSSASQQLDNKKNEFEKELVLLKNSAQADLSSFAEEQKKLRIKALEEKFTDVRDSIRDMTLTLSDKYQKEIEDSIWEQNTLDELKAYVESSQLKNKCEEYAGNMLEVSALKFSDMHAVYSDEMSAFWKAFEEKFKDLNILPVDFTDVELTESFTLQTDLDDLSAANIYLSEQLSKENGLFWGGFAAGAVVGSMIAPGVGTIIGGVIGIFAGTRLAPDLYKVKQQTINDLLPLLKKYFENISEIAVKSAYDGSKQACIDIEKEIDKYPKKYKNDIKRRIEQQEIKRSVIESQIREIHMDNEKINNRKSTLNSFVQKLQSKYERTE